MAETVGTVLGAAGACPEIELNGKVWKIGHPTQRAKAELEKLAVGTAVAEMMELKDVMPEASFKALFSELTDSIAAKHYRTWGPGWQRVVWGPQSTHLFLLSLLRECHPNASEDDARQLAAAEPEQVTAALLQVIPNFVSLLLLSDKRITPEQREKAMGVVTERLSTLAQASGTQPQPEPTAATCAT